MWCRVHRGAGRGGTVRCGVVRYGTVRYGTARYGTARYGKVRGRQGHRQRHARRRSTGDPLGRALASLVRHNGRRYGGYIVHVGVLPIALGIIGNEFYQSEAQANLRIGESVTVANYTLTYRNLDARDGPNYTEFEADMGLTRDGQPSGQILPKKLVFHKNQEQPMTEVGLRAGLIEDVYVVLAGFDSMGTMASFKIYVNPLMSWMWIGGLVIILGVFVSAWPRRIRVRSRARASIPENAQTATS